MAKRDAELDEFLRRLVQEGARDEGREGEQIGGRYRLGAVIGRGAAGVVRLAVDDDGARFAIKLLSTGAARDRVAAARFRREIGAAQLLDHPNIARVVDHGVDGSRPFIVMELLEGETLADELARTRKLGAARAREVLGPVASALAHAHRSLVVHRDVKPENIFVANAAGGSIVKLLDFGIAKLLALHATSLTRSGARLGTPAYMAPEQIESPRAAGSACDQYALGAVLFEALSGLLPHDAASAEAMLRAKVSSPARPLDRLAPELPAPICEVVMRSLERDPARRYPSVDALWSQFERALHG